jgi:hypothetical protein
MAGLDGAAAVLTLDDPVAVAQRPDDERPDGTLVGHHEHPRGEPIALREGLEPCASFGDACIGLSPPDARTVGFYGNLRIVRWSEP